MVDLRANLPRMLVLSRVAALGSFTAAAQELGLSRPAVSAAVSSLEASLGVTLLHRTTRTLRPTQVGEAFLDRCGALVELADEAVSEAVAASDNPVGVLRLSSPGGLIAEQIVAPVITRLVREHGITVDLRCSDARRPLVEGGFDVALRVGIPREAGLVMRRVGRTREVLVASPELAATIETPEDLNRIGWVCHAELPRNLALGKSGRAQTLAMRPVALVDDSVAMLELIRRGVGVGRIIRI